jgi:hypothetical protein
LEKQNLRDSSDYVAVRVGNGNAKASRKELRVETRNVLTSRASLELLKRALLDGDYYYYYYYIVPVRSNLYCVLILARNFHSSYRAISIEATCILSLSF